MNLCKYSLATAALIIMTGCAKTESTAIAAGNPAPPAVSVKLATATHRNISVEIKTDGKVEGIACDQVTPLIGGTIMKANFNEGDTGKKGDVLFEIDPRTYPEAIKQWEANLARDQALQ